MEGIVYSYIDTFYLYSYYLNRISTNFITLYRQYFIVFERIMLALMICRALKLMQKSQITNDEHNNINNNNNNTNHVQA
jgi:hypothetical protein